jgi:adhesin/invasin
VIASDGSVSGTSPAITTVAGAANRYIVTSSSTNPIVNATVTVSAQLADAHGNAVATSGLVVSWTSTNGGTLGSATSSTNAGGIATVSFNVSSQVTTHVVTATQGARTGSVSISTQASSGGSGTGRYF